MVKNARWVIVGALCFWGGALGGSAWAQEAPQAKASPQKIGFVNLEAIEAGWIEYQILKRDMEMFFQLDKRDIQRLRQDIDKRVELMEERRKQGEVSDRAYANFRQDIALQRRKVEIYTEIRALIVQDKVDQQREKANQIVEEMIRKIGEEEGFDLILESTNLLGTHAGLDISQKVVNVLNTSDLGLTGPSSGAGRF